MASFGTAVLVLSLFWSLNSPFPYVSFMGQTLANHSYVNLSTVESDSVQCHSDLVVVVRVIIVETGISLMD